MLLSTINLHCAKDREICLVSQGVGLSELHGQKKHPSRLGAGRNNEHGRLFVTLVRKPWGPARVFYDFSTYDEGRRCTK